MAKFPIWQSCLHSHQTLARNLCGEIINMIIISNMCFAGRRTPDCKIKSNTDLIAITMCPKQPDASHHGMACIQRQCRECGPQAIEQHTAALASSVGDHEQTWQFWTTKDYINNNQKTSKQKVLESKRDR